MRAFGKRLHWLDLAILFLLIAFAGVIWLRIEGSLNYRWRWEIVPGFVLRWHQDEERWVANLLLQGFAATVRIAIYASILALILGTILGIARCARNLAVRMLARTYLEVLRNIPPVVVIFIFFFFLSEQLVAVFRIEDWARAIARRDDNGLWEFFFGDMRRFPSLISGVFVLALFESAFVGEIVRAGIQSVPDGQREAARSLGMNWLGEMRLVVLPQAMRKVLPPLANQFISLIKDSAIVSLISVQELTYKTLELVASTRAIFEAWIATAALYFLLCFGLSRFFAWMERRRRF